MTSDARRDAQRLYDVATTIYNVWMFFGVWLPAIVGGIAALVILLGGLSTQSGGGAGLGAIGALGIAGVTAIICIINYAFAVMSTHIAKVLAHLLLNAIETKPPVSQQNVNRATTNRAASSVGNEILNGNGKAQDGAIDPAIGISSQAVQSTPPVVMPKDGTVGLVLSRNQIIGNVVSGGAADEAGLKSQDKILSIDEKNVAG